MEKPLGVGFSLHPDVDFYKLTSDILLEADYFEVNPEALWTFRDDQLIPNQFYEFFREFPKKTQKPFVGHSLAFSLGTPIHTPEEEKRTALWLDQLQKDQEAFEFLWMTDHLGWVVSDGLNVVLPQPLPFTKEAVDTVCQRLRRLSEIFPKVGFENGADLFRLGKIEEEPGFFNEICSTAPCGMNLDLHNAYTQSVNFECDIEEYVSNLHLENVFQIHLSGGSLSKPHWNSKKSVFRLDSHDNSIPEEVWTLAENVIPQCPNLRGVVVERLNGTVKEEEVPDLLGEVRRAKELFSC